MDKIKTYILIRKLIKELIHNSNLEIKLTIIHNKKMIKIRKASNLL